MSVISVKEDYRSSGPSSTRLDLITLRASKDDARVFDVLFSQGETAAERRVLAKTAVDPFSGEKIPQYWEQHPADPWLFVTSITSSQGTGPFHYKVAVNYVSVGNPLEQPMEIEWLHNITNELVDREATGKAITNSANESFDPPITKEVYDLVLRLKRNEELFNPINAVKYTGAINNDNFVCPADYSGTTVQYPPGVVKCTLLKGIPKRAATLYYHEVHYEFQFRLGEIEETEPGTWEVLGLGWKKRILDQGFRTLKKEDGEWTGEYEPILDAEGNPVREPQLLDGKGEQLKEPTEDGDGIDADGTPGQFNRFKGVFLTFDVNKKLPFSDLMLA